MPYLTTAQAFLEQSILLISARPTTTRITTTYNIPHPNPPPSKYKPTSFQSSNPSNQPSDNQTQSGSETEAQAALRARRLQPKLTLKTFDTASGTCLKYRTDKAAEVGRLVASLGRCGRVMAGLPLEEEGEMMEGVEGEEAREVAKEVMKDLKVGPVGGAERGKGPGGEGGGKKKKKGKR